MAAGKQFMVSSLHNGGRRAGIGISYDDYSEESGNKSLEMRRPMVRFPSDMYKPEDLNGPVIIVQEGMRKDGK